MKVTCKEHHLVTRTMHYNIDDEVLKEDWNDSIEELESAIVNESHPRHDEAVELMEAHGFEDENEDWVSDRRGDYEVDWSLGHG